MIKPREKERQTKASKNASEFKSLEKSNYVGDKDLLNTLDRRRMNLIETLEGSSMKVLGSLLSHSYLTVRSRSFLSFPPSWKRR